MNVVRLNTAHQGPEGMRKVINNVREVSSHIAVLVDTKGPEVRTTRCEAPIEFHKGEMVEIVGNPEIITTHERIAVSYKNFVDDLNVGSHILIDDGDLGLFVEEKPPPRSSAAWKTMPRSVRARVSTCQERASTCQP